jgi:hypothetical protein
MAQPTGKLGPYVVEITVEYILRDLQITENVEELVTIVGPVLCSFLKYPAAVTQNTQTPSHVTLIAILVFRLLKSCCSRAI